MSDIIEQYYRGISQQLQAEVNFINSLFHHQGIKGEGNELVLRELLTKFIPKKYGVSTGVIIDKLGQQSKQCDIVIYDAHMYPSLLSLASVHLFPVDIVYAAIEVKTTLDASEAKGALANIASVKSLSVIEEKFTEIVYRNDHLQTATYLPNPPLGFVFAYNSEAQNFATFKNWFTPVEDNKAPLYPTAVCCLDQGIVKFSNLYPQAGDKPEGWAMPLWTYSRDGIPDHVPLDTPSFVPPNKLAEREKEFYPIKTFKVSTPREYETTVAIDPSRILLLFTLWLSELLSQRRINPKISFINHYLSFLTKSYFPQ